MKKFLSLILAPALLLSVLAGCAPSGGGAATPDRKSVV